MSRRIVRGDGGTLDVFFFLDASKTSDVIDYWNLRALGGPVIPVPKQLVSNVQLRKIVEDFLKSHRRHWKHNPSVCDCASLIRSRGCTMEEMQEYCSTLKIDRAPTVPSQHGFFTLQHWYPRIWDRWGRDNDGATPSDPYGKEESSIEITETDKFVVNFKALMPKFASKYGFTGGPRCANEVSFSLYGSEEYLAQVFPKSPGQEFDRAISGWTSTGGEWRVGRNGLVKLVARGFNEHRDIPAAENIVFSWLRDQGWKPELSAPGLLAKQIYKKLEGNVAVLRNEALLRLLEHMNGGRVQQTGKSPDNEDEEVGPQRDLSVGEVKNRLANSGKRAGNLHQYLIDRAIFRLGLRMRCPRCIRRSWWALQGLQDSIVCPLCLNTFQAAGNMDVATWSYKAAGPFSVPNYADGAYSVLLTLAQFTDLRMNTLRSTPALSFTAEGSNKQKLEADFALFWQESLYGETRDGVMFGECKTYGRFEKKDFRRMSDLGKTFPGAVLVFSSLKKSLTPGEIAGITRVAKKGRRYWKNDSPINPVLILTGTELLDWQGPPYCWGESVKKDFQRFSGLLGLCEASQQLYLNLPAWHTDWRNQWEARRRRRLERIAGEPSIEPLSRH